MSDPSSANPNRDPIHVTGEPELADLIPSFLENRKDDVERARDALDGGDMETAESVAHSIKGLGGGYGFDGLSDLAADLEEQARDGDVERALDTVTAMQDYLDRVQWSPAGS